MNQDNQQKKDGEKDERSFQEQRVREITLIYYSQPEIKKILYKFSQGRECIPRYYESFGKRPDTFQYENDIVEQVKKGATSFHCSEELWNDSLELNTDLSRSELNKLRTGWDLLLDIDSKYLEYSKIYAALLINALKFHGLENIGVKFSGNRGFHLIIPWKAFPNEIYGQKTKDMFPEWPRIIGQYLANIIKPKLVEKIFQEQSLKELAEKTGKKESELIIDECVSCNRQAVKKYKMNWICRNCKNMEVLRYENNRIPKCPNENCRKPLVEKSRTEVLVCEYCNFNSDDNPEMFKKSREKTEILIEADLILVSPRHLFRMPYSLHEKTALSSIVIDKKDIENFQITDAKPFKTKIKNFYPEPKQEEAKELLLQALDWHEQKQTQDLIIKEKKEAASHNDVKADKNINKDYKKITIPNPSEEIFPPQIKLILKGIKQDGRKRALFILISFFKSLGVSDNEIEKRIFDWNELNYKPIKKGYIISQLNWYKKNSNRLPPNFNNPIYKDLGVDKPDKLAMETKNPVSYAVKRYFMMKK
mgnify:CR=1 FL=1